MSYDKNANLSLPYWLFAGDYYYPSGGMDDFVDAFDTLEAARDHADTLRVDWWHVIDREIGYLHSNPLGWKPAHKR